MSDFQFLANAIMTIKIIQDGRDFYNENTGNVIYTDPVPYKDPYSVEEAIGSRKTFEKWMKEQNPNQKFFFTI